MTHYEMLKYGVHLVANSKSRGVEGGASMRGGADVERGAGGLGGEEEEEEDEVEREEIAHLIRLV
jgi:hypothetical protein